jgi:hypothetical protein
LCLNFWRHISAIAGLLERCVEPIVPFSDISDVLPQRIRDKITIIKSRRLRRNDVTEEDEQRMKAGGRQAVEDRLDTEDCAYGPVIQELDTKQTERQRHGEGSSLRIPGAVVVDPHVRRLAELSGLTTSENAVWLMVVAVKEYAKSLIDFTISSTNAVEAGQLPPRLNTRVPALPRKRTASDGAGESRHTKRLKCISSIDLHSVASNLPLSGQALGGCLSRETFERGLFMTYDRSSVIGENAFTDLKSFIIASVTPSHSKRLKVEPPKPTIKTSTDEALKGRKSPSVRGLGRGAKDLAALKARAGQISSIPSADLPTGSSTESTPAVSSVKEQTNTVTKLGATQTNKLVAQGASDTAPQMSETKTDLSTTTKSTPIVPATSKAIEQQPLTKTDESDIDATDPVESKQQSLAQRRGKGHGVKSLAAMRARSATSTELLGATQQVAASEPAETQEQFSAMDTIAPGAKVVENELSSTEKVPKQPVEESATPEKKESEVMPEQRPRLESAIEEVVVVRRPSAEKRKASIDHGMSDAKVQRPEPSESQTASKAPASAPSSDGPATTKVEAPEISNDPANPEDTVRVPSANKAEAELKAVTAKAPAGAEGTVTTTAAAPETTVSVQQSASSAPPTEPCVSAAAAVESKTTTESKSGDAVTTTASGEPNKTPGEAETTKTYASEDELFR